ncbi:hypothetical protein [Primorskyibacter sp. S87]|uniref:hypothetical protein n=1 Tax=Primorskyibacter sp. S87 TaxID=3415126 RepID=UPI003C7A95BC
MKRFVCIIAACAGLSSAPVYAQDTCPWADGIYHFSSHGINGDFGVNADCTEMIWSRLSEPETAALTRTEFGWKGSLKNADVELLNNGHNLRVTEHGGMMRQSNAERTN